MANKVKYGLCNVFYAMATLRDDGTATYGTPVRFPGAVSLSLEPQGDQTIFRADNINYWVGQSNNGYQGDFEIARIIDSFRKDVLGDKTDSNGALVEDADAQPKPFALMFQFDGDEKNTRHVMYNCTVSRPTVAGSTTDETIEPQTETVTLTASTIWNNALEINTPKASVEQDNPLYATWNDAVYIPGSAAPAQTYTVTQNLASGVTSDFSDTTVNAGASLEIELTEDTSVTIDTVTVTMGGVDVAGAFDTSTNKITIAAVTGNVVISVSVS